MVNGEAAPRPKDCSVTFTTTLATTITTAETTDALDAAARTLWQAVAAGIVADQEAEELGALVDARRTARTPLSAPGNVGALKPLRSPFSTGRATPRSPDQQRSRMRARRIAASGPLPPALACQFTTSELAALAIIGDASSRNGRAMMTHGEVAARAGVSVSTVKRALAEARRLGLVTTQERRRRLAPNLPNVVRVVSAEWRTWLEMRRRREGGVQEGAATGTILPKRLRQGQKPTRIRPESREGVPSPRPPGRTRRP